MNKKANSQLAPVHWLREITKAKLSQAEPSQVGQVESIGAIANIWERRGRKNKKREIGQVWTSLEEFGQV